MTPPARLVGRGRRRLLSREMGAVGLLAASLVMGVVIGSSSLPARILPALTDMTGIAADRDDLIRIALYEEVMQ
jgi:hypothetical protein